MLGFVILSHNNPSQLNKLILALNRLYNSPPIACHHDFSQAMLESRDFPKNVWFVSDYLRTSWGHWSVTGGAIRGLRLLYERADPTWFSLLSAADYPIASADAVYADLQGTAVDAFLDLRPVLGSSPTRHIGTMDPDLSAHDNLQLAIKRYMHARIKVPRVATQIFRRFRGIGYTSVDDSLVSYRLPFISPIGPFDRTYRCYVGSQWFTGNRRAAMKLLYPSRRDEAVMRYFESRWHADESFVNTVLGNKEDIIIDINPRRFSRWTFGSAHPRLLTDSDISIMLKSRQHFARKFTHQSTAISKIDEALQIV